MTVDETHGAIMGRSSKLAVCSLSDLVHFVGYFSSFCGPRAFSMIDEPRVEIMGRSPTLIVVADPDPFHGLNLTVLESQSNFHD